MQCNSISQASSAVMSGGLYLSQVVCTLGPKSRSVPMLEELLRAGMAVARFNFSHGSYDYHQVRFPHDACCQNSVHMASLRYFSGNFGQPENSYEKYQNYVRRHARHKGGCISIRRCMPIDELVPC